MKIINIVLLKIKFELILGDYNFNQSDNIMCVNDKKMKLYLIYKHYIYCDFVFQKLNKYKYFRFIFIIKRL